MTNVRLTLNAADEWEFCPYCGRRTELDQSPDLIVRTPDGIIDEEASIGNGFNFEQSVRHCGYHVRLWMALDDCEGVE